MGHARRTVPVVTACVMQVGTGWITLASGLLTPLWAFLLLGLVWMVCVGLLVHLATNRPLLSPLAPIANAVVWWGVLAAGQAWFGWRP
jgi:hypothetical protein